MNLLGLNCFGELFIIDNLAHLKTLLWLESPYHAARANFWDQWAVLFWNDSPSDVPWNNQQRVLNDTTYWKHPPTLELPERAQSLQDWEHCIFCGFPLDNWYADCFEIQERGFIYVRHNY